MYPADNHPSSIQFITAIIMLRIMQEKLSCNQTALCYSYLAMSESNCLGSVPRPFLASPIPIARIISRESIPPPKYFPDGPDPTGQPSNRATRLKLFRPAGTADDPSSTCTCTFVVRQMAVPKRNKGHRPFAPPVAPSSPPRLQIAICASRTTCGAPSPPSDRALVEAVPLFPPHGSRGASPKSCCVE
jgi:hypothetical protein